MPVFQDNNTMGKTVGASEILVVVVSPKHKTPDQSQLSMSIGLSRMGMYPKM